MQRTIFDRVSAGGNNKNGFPLQVSPTGTVTCLTTAPATAAAIGRRIFIGFVIIN